MGPVTRSAVAAGVASSFQPTATQYKQGRGETPEQGPEVEGFQVAFDRKSRLQKVSMVPSGQS